ncbi:hypothetical protein C8R41DRAFT_919766 [Lentinula lateritia]|uniref:DUF6532 domain-containing protein n=1 Tax=Lentinula lateritia TaxID=40482 RepID=A0ABQ8VG60_9AGAR|nr:hypothetical protein C8R41DRAFT_919766 [Lentinula lateritia]
MHRSRRRHRQQTPLEETKTSFAIHTDTDGSDEEHMVHDHISKHDSDGDEEEGDDNDNNNNNNIEDELEDCTPPPPPPKRRKNAAGRSDTSEQRMSTRARTNGKPKEPNDAQLRREYEAMKKREARLKKRVQGPYEENVDADSNQDIESEDETRGNIIWGPAARPLETISTTNTVKRIAAKKRKTNRSATSTPHSAVSTSLATSASHSTATSRSTTPSRSTPTSAMPVLSSTCLASPGMPQVNDALSTAVSSFTEEKLPPLNFHAHYTATGKPKAEDYDATGKAILLRACHDFEAKVIGLNFFPTPMTRARWAEEAFLAACANANCAHSSDKRVIQLINARASRIRGDLVKWTRTKIQTVFGFNADKGKKYNKKIYQGLSARNFSAFLYKDPDLLTGYAENPSITTFISYIFSTRIGRLYESYFNPVSLNMLSGFFAVIRFAIAEWSTGECIQNPPKFTEVDNNPIMMRYLEDLEKWAGMNKNFTDKFRSRMYSRALSKVYKTQESTHSSHITGSIEASMRLELELRTGDTESEDNGMDEDSDHSDYSNPAPVDLSSAGAPRNPSTASSSTEASGNSPAG